MTHCKQVNKALRESSSQPRTARPSTACIVLSVVIGQPALGDVSEVICACHPHGEMAPRRCPFHPRASHFSLGFSDLQATDSTEHCNIVGIWKIPLPVIVIQTGRASSIRTTLDTGYKMVNDQRLSALREPSPHRQNVLKSRVRAAVCAWRWSSSASPS